MSGWFFRYRLQIKVPRPIPTPLYTPPRINSYMVLSYKTSDLLRNATDGNFAEDVSEAAFNRDMKQYTEINGTRSAEIMSSRFVLILMGPTVYLKRLFEALYLPQTDPYETDIVGGNPIFFAWVRVDIRIGPLAQAESSHLDDDEEQD